MSTGITFFKNKVLMDLHNGELLIKGLGEHLGIELKLDEQQMCFLMIDETMLSMRLLDNCFLLYGMLGEFPEFKHDGFWKSLLSLNKSLVEANRGAITFDEESDAVMLVQYVEGTGLNVNDLAEKISVFIDQLNHLIHLLNEEEPEDELPDDDIKDHIHASASHIPDKEKNGNTNYNDFSSWA